MEVEYDVHDFGPGGGRFPDLWHVLQCGHAGKSPDQIRELGGDPPGWAYPWRIPA